MFPFVGVVSQDLRAALEPLSRMRMARGRDRLPAGTEDSSESAGLCTPGEAPMRILLVTLIVSSALGVVAEAKDRWLEARSAHFTVVSNGREGRAKSILEDLEQLRRLITEIFPSHKVDDAEPAVFYLFKNEKSMRPFQPTRDGKREDWAGMYRTAPLRSGTSCSSGPTDRPMRLGEWRSASTCTFSGVFEARVK